MLATRFLPPIAILLLLSGCRSGPERAPAIGKAFAGPASANLRQDLHPRSPTVATIKHGDPLEVIERRRRFFKVRTVQGVEGWTEARQLLSVEEMAKLNRTAELSAQIPSQGSATVFDALNIHTEPNRQSPSFAQIPEKGLVDVIGQRSVPRTPYASRILSIGTPGPATPRRKPKKKKKDEILPPLPMPAPPGPPANWLELSKTPRSEGDESDEQEANLAANVPTEDWSLVRTADGKAGWVLTRMLVMAIPDEVAQYAEGHRITSYFALGEVRDGEEVKKAWLWTTLSSPPKPYQFDGFRVFVWSLRRHRYETAYIERNVEGYYPVTLELAEKGNGSRDAQLRGFSLILREKDGSLARRTYAFSGPRPRVVSKAPWRFIDDAEAIVPRSEAAPQTGEQVQSPALGTRLKERIGNWRKRWFQR